MEKEITQTYNLCEEYRMIDWGDVNVLHKITDPSIPMYLSNYRIKGLSKVNISNDNGTILHSFLATTTVFSLSYLHGGT